ncbi:MAG: hypothetical protein PHE79_11345, partial [Eubacteriales bacterium]|nr:hypothetical protein [Eubacteriales bacterium]
YKVGKVNKTTINKAVPRVAILDPACGTGTFHAEIIKYVKNKYFSGGHESFFKDYILDKNGLLSRLIAFEIMMTSYVVAHLKVRRTVDEALHSSVQKSEIPHSNIYLTNTLSQPSSELEQLSLFPVLDFSGAVIEQTRRADEWKARRPIKVIIGNPPYNPGSKNPYDISAYKTEVDGVTDFNEQKHWLNNDYIKFFRFAENIINKNGEGILAYVSDHGYLDNPTDRGMRGSLLRTFNKIFIVNLHGNSNDGEVCPDGSKDENVFKIRQGVSLFIGIKTSKKTDHAKVYYADVWGGRRSKLQKLLEGSVEFTEIFPDAEMAYFIPSNTHGKLEYNRGTSVTDILPLRVTGIVSGNDDMAYQKNKNDVEKLKAKIAISSKEEVEIIWNHLSRGQTSGKIISDATDHHGVIAPIALHPFDERWTLYTGQSCGWILWPREKTTMGNLIKTTPCPLGRNFGLVFCKTSRSFFAPFVANSIIAHRLFSALAEITYISPLYLYNEYGKEEWIPNLNPDAVNKLTANMKRKPGPVEVFDYIYGILHDPAYAEKYEAYLNRDYPRVPIINVEEDRDNPDAFFVSEVMFWDYAHFGSCLRDLHLMNIKAPLDLKIEPNDSENLEINAIKYESGVLHINENKQITGIPIDVWRYNIGGHEVIQKWFKSHKGEIMSLKNFTHIENVVGLIHETILTQEKIKKMHDTYDKQIKSAFFRNKGHP